MLVEIRFPAAPRRSGTEFLEISRRHGDFALVSVGAQVTLSPAGALEDIRLALGGVGASPFDAGNEAKRLVGIKPQQADFEALGVKIAKGIEPSDDLHASAEYRKEVAAVLVKRALRTALTRAKDNA
jgi:CO/xanthine dehydrogenase FAD-binding subunit